MGFAEDDTHNPPLTRPGLKEFVHVERYGQPWIG